MFWTEAKRFLWVPALIAVVVGVVQGDAVGPQNAIRIDVI